jgi:hypothetical protein
MAHLYPLEHRLSVILESGAAVQAPDTLKKRVVDRIEEGDSQLKLLLHKGYTIDQVIRAIHERKCLGNLGSTYLEQMIGNTLSDLVKDGNLPASGINTYRRVFGLPPLGENDDLGDKVPGMRSMKKRGRRQRHEKKIKSGLPVSQKIDYALGIRNANVQ